MMPVWLNDLVAVVIGVGIPAFFIIREALLSIAWREGE